MGQHERQQNYEVLKYLILHVILVKQISCAGEHGDVSQPRWVMGRQSSHFPRSTEPHYALRHPLFWIFSRGR